MEYNFCIYPKKCMAQTENLNRAASELANCAKRISAVKSQISHLGGSYANVSECLESLMQEVEREKKSLDSMRDTLKECMDFYVETDSKIAAGTLKMGAEGRSSWADALADIAKIRGEEWDVSLESFMTKGLFGNGVYECMKEIMGGTYIVSERNNGKLYLKLHQDGMTNAQISAWLEENLGGSWSDYRSRNMRDYNFNVYDFESESYTRTKRYFDNLVDSDLDKYLKNLEGSSFGKTLCSEFKPFEDFNYKEFGELSKLGKAGKAMGTVGTVFTIGGDVVNNYYDSATGTWSFSANQTADCVWDVGVDLTAGAGSAAVGAAVGSLIVPPVGTVVGAGVGIAVDYAANNIKLWDVDGDGKNDSLVDTIKIGGHAAIDWIGDTADDVGDWLGAAFSF